MREVAAGHRDQQQNRGQHAPEGKFHALSIASSPGNVEGRAAAFASGMDEDACFNKGPARLLAIRQMVT